MQLKDASAYNIQFDGCRPVLIDSLSFERLETNKPWKAYGQFCRHFLAPLALMAKTHIDLGYLLRDYIDGIPLEMASRMLPMRTRWSIGLQLHVHWHARMIAKHHATGLCDDNTQFWADGASANSICLNSAQGISGKSAPYDLALQLKNGNTR